MFEFPPKFEETTSEGEQEITVEHQEGEAIKTPEVVDAYLNRPIQSNPFNEPEMGEEQHPEWLPCYMDGDGSCECFKPDDTYKGAPVYYQRPICKLRAAGEDVPDELPPEPPKPAPIPEGFVVCSSCGSTVRGFEVEEDETLTISGSGGINVPRLHEDLRLLADAFSNGRTVNAIALLKHLMEWTGAGE